MIYPPQPLSIILCGYRNTSIPSSALSSAKKKNATMHKDLFNNTLACFSSNSARSVWKRKVFV